MFQEEEGTGYCVHPRREIEGHGPGGWPGIEAPRRDKSFISNGICVILAISWEDTATTWNFLGFHK